MPTFGSYSPWQDASENVFRPAGNSLNALAIEIAKARYNRNNRAAEMGLQLEKLQQQEIMNQVHQKLYDAQTGQAGSATRFNDARTAHQQAVDSAASDLQTSVVANDYPNPLQNGPTIADQAQMLAARQHGAAAKVAGLHGTPQEAFQVHNIPANNIAMDPMSGMTVGEGALELAPGAMYQAPGQEPVVNQRPYFAPAGSTPFSQAGQQTGRQTGFRPTSPGAKSSAVDAALVRALASGDIDKTSPLYDSAMRAATNSGPAQATSSAPVDRPPHTPEEEKLLQDANDAISKGADPVKVKARLQQMGYNPN